MLQMCYCGFIHYCIYLLFTCLRFIIYCLFIYFSQDYGNSIDPVSALGLDASALDSYQVEEVVSGPHLPRPELLPYGYCVGDVDAVLVWLKVGGYG